eukprot:316107-Hanusia_phi.AAC.1
MCIRDRGRKHKEGRTFEGLLLAVGDERGPEHGAIEANLPWARQGLQMGGRRRRRQKYLLEADKIG